MIKPWFSRLLQHPARKRSGSILGHNTHTHVFTYLLSLDPHGEAYDKINQWHCMRSKDDGESVIIAQNQYTRWPKNGTVFLVRLNFIKY